MIDWLSFKLPYRAAMIADQYVYVPYDEGKQPKTQLRHVHVKGSYDSGMAFIATGSHLQVTGNPVKWLTGQNVVGINCARTLILMTYEALVEMEVLPDCLSARRAIKNDDITMSRVDCTFAYDVGTYEDVNTWLRAMETSAHVVRRGRGHFSPQMNSLAWGMGNENGRKGSRRSSFKFYNKEAELKAHPPVCHPDFIDGITDIARGIVRGEATFRSTELARTGHQHLHFWDLNTAYKLHRRWIDNMDISESARLSVSDELALPKRLVSTYRHWERGEDLLTVLTKPTFYRHRKDLLVYGIDIAISSGKKLPERKAIPVLRVITADPVDESAHEELFWNMIEKRQKTA